MSKLGEYLSKEDADAIEKGMLLAMLKFAVAGENLEMQQEISDDVCKVLRIALSYKDQYPEVIGEIRTILEPLFNDLDEDIINTTFKSAYELLGELNVLDPSITAN